MRAWLFRYHLRKTVNNWTPNGPRYTSSQIWTAIWSSYRASYVVLIGYRCCGIKYNCMWQATFYYSCEEGCGASEKWPSFWLYLNLKIFCLVTCHHSPVHIHYCLYKWKIFRILEAGVNMPIEWRLILCPVITSPFWTILFPSFPSFLKNCHECCAS